METRNFIAGHWCSDVSTVSSLNPSDITDVLGDFAQASASDLNRAIISAKAAQLVWAKTGLEQRQTALMFIGNELMARAEEIGRLLSREEGKPLAEGRGEVYRAGQFFTYYAAEVLRQIGQTADSVRPDIEVDVRREPVGLVAIISPWNFPIATASWKIAPALAFGNAVIWKPANLTPACATALTDIISRAGLPVGLFNLVMGSGDDIGQALIESPEINAVSFTGSVAIGRKVAKAASANFTKIQLEMGSKNALIVMDDCDMARAVTHAVNGAFGGTGQKCTASSRLVVHKRVLNEFVDQLAQATKKLKVGHALEADTNIGPVVSEAQLNSNLNYLKRGKVEGVTLITGGTVLERPTKGYYMEPALFADTNNNMVINREEMFGPIACVISADGYEHALSIVNDTPFGLTSGIMTKSLARANHFRRNVRTGRAMVNLPTAGTDYHVPFGGRGHSSYGPREQGYAAVEFYTTIKTSYIYSGNPE